MSAYPHSNPAETREGYIPVENAALYYREAGRGRPVIVLHGGPDFDHSYLLPDLDSLADAFRLIYYDQRGRGRSAGNVRPEDVTLRSEIEDLERVRVYFGLEAAAVLGHSWGGVLALEYATHHPDRVSHLILMNTAPASHDDYMLLRQDLREQRTEAEIERMNALSSSDEYREGDPDTVADYYRIHFRPALRQPEHVDSVVQHLRASFTQEGILKARAIEDRLMAETWLSAKYNLLPRLQRLNVSTLVVHGDHDFIPVARVAPIAQAIPGARFLLLADCGHFSYLERPDRFREAFDDFIKEYDVCHNL